MCSLTGIPLPPKALSNFLAIILSIVACQGSKPNQEFGDYDGRHPVYLSTASLEMHGLKDDKTNYRIIVHGQWPLRPAAVPACHPTSQHFQPGKWLFGSHEYSSEQQLPLLPPGLGSTYSQSLPSKHNRSCPEYTNPRQIGTSA